MSCHPCEEKESKRKHQIAEKKRKNKRKHQIAEKNRRKQKKASDCRKEEKESIRLQKELLPFDTRRTTEFLVLNLILLAAPLNAIHSLTLEKNPASKSSIQTFPLTFRFALKRLLFQSFSFDLSHTNSYCFMSRISYQFVFRVKEEVNFSVRCSRSPVFFCVRTDLVWFVSTFCDIFLILFCFFFFSFCCPTIALWDGPSFIKEISNCWQPKSYTSKNQLMASQALPCHGPVEGGDCEEKCLNFDPTEEDKHVCVCGHPKNRHPPGMFVCQIHS